VATRQQISVGMAQVIAERFHLLAEPTRIRILDVLREGPLTVGTLTQRIGTSQQNVSKHLGMLHRAGIVAREKDGTLVRYRIADHSVLELCEDVCGGINRHLGELRSMMEEGVTR
jgi:DNA-binding transcriptional ArsR family regulator